MRRAMQAFCEDDQTKKRLQTQYVMVPSASSVGKSWEDWNSPDRAH